MRQKVKTASLTSRRIAALDAVPRRSPVVRSEMEGGKLRVTVKMNAGRWQRMLGANATVNRTFGLDKYGHQVYEACDGKRTVKEIVKGFAEETHVSLPEAETAVTKFIHTLLCKALLVIEMERPSK